MTRVKYIGFYNHNSSHVKRTCALSAVNKMDYVISSLNAIGYGVDLISPSWLTADEKRWFVKSEKVTLDQNNYLYSPSFKTKYKIVNYFAILMSWFWLFFYLLFKVRKDEKIIVYHSMWLLTPLIPLRLFRNINITLEVEEIYSDVNPLHKIFRKWELYFISISSSYLFSTDLLEQKINLSKKPSAVLYGTYQVFPQISNPADDNKVHLLYAGIIDKHKAGAFNAVDAMQFLDEKYVLHIIGFGDTNALQERIREVIPFLTSKIYFDGSKKGTDFISYAQKCHIGLSTQKMGGEYLDTSFPSKILTYLNLGLYVISCRIKCVENSAVNEFVNYYDIDDPQRIAHAIRNINVPHESSNKLIDRLDIEFKNNLRVLLQLN